jgi:hypothetical protein
MVRNYIVFIVLGIVALALGISIKIFVGRRKFYRRNQAGLEGFKSYRNALITPFVETVLTFIAALLIIAGAICLAAATITSR